MTTASDTPPVSFDSQEWLTYTSSPAWENLTNRVFTAWGGDYCQGCWTKNNVAVYHLTFERYGHEADTDMIPLCLECMTEFYKTYVHSGAYESLRAAGFAFLKHKKQARRKFVLAAHDAQGNPIIRKKHFNDRVQWWLKMNTQGRVLTAIGALAVLAALVPLSVLVFTVVVNVLVWVVAIAAAAAMLLFVLVVVFGVSLAGFGAAAGGGKTRVNTTQSGATKITPPKVDWKIVKDATGNTLIQQDKAAAWARGGETYYQVVKDATGNTILKQKTW